MKYRFFPLLLLATALASCGVHRQLPVVRDSVRIEFRDRLVHDTAYFQVPVEVEKSVTLDTISYLSNSLAESEAVVSAGTLTHTLRTKPQRVPVPTERVVRDTVIVHEKAQILTQTVEVEKPLSLWQKARIWAFLPLLILAIVGWRRELLKGLKRILSLIKR